MKLEIIGLEFYKAFRELPEFKISPLTFLIGKNSSGKSALSRLPLLLAQSFKENSDEPLKLQFDGIEFGGDFSDLIYRRYAHGNIKMKLSLSDGVNVEFEIQNISGLPLQVISNWKIESSFLNIAMTLQLEKDNINSTEGRLYIIDNARVNVFFAGLLPRTILDSEGEPLYKQELLRLASVFTSLSNSIHYIGPLREPAHRIYSFSGSTPKSLGLKGENAPKIFGMASFFNNDLLENVGAWFLNNLGCLVTISKELRSFEVVLENPEAPEFQVNFVDVGQGISQVFPLVVRCFLPGFENTLTIIEQPELH